jgi:hypothetical protein
MIGACRIGLSACFSSRQDLGPVNPPRSVVYVVLVVLIDLVVVVIDPGAVLGIPMRWTRRSNARWVDRQISADEYTLSEEDESMPRALHVVRCMCAAKVEHIAGTHEYRTRTRLAQHSYGLRLRVCIHTCEYPVPVRSLQPHNGLADFRKGTHATSRVEMHATVVAVRGGSGGVAAPVLCVGRCRARGVPAHVGAAPYRRRLESVHSASLALVWPSLSAEGALHTSRELAKLYNHVKKCQQGNSNKARAHRAGLIGHPRMRSCLSRVWWMCRHWSA